MEKLLFPNTTSTFSKREHFMVSLRKEKKSQIINQKRRKIYAQTDNKPTATASEVFVQDLSTFQDSKQSPFYKIYPIFQKQPFQLETLIRQVAPLVNSDSENLIQEVCYLLERLDEADNMQRLALITFIR